MKAHKDARVKIEEVISSHEEWLRDPEGGTGKRVMRASLTVDRWRCGDFVIKFLLSKEEDARWIG